MTDLASLLRDLRDLESPGQGTPGTPGSPVESGAPLVTVPAPEETNVEATTAAPATMAMDDPMNDARGVLCDDCGRPTVIAMVTDYGARYCRECVFPDATHSKTTKAPVVPTDTQGELVQ